MAWVYSTSTQSVNYHVYGPAVAMGALRPILKTITIHGGANAMDASQLLTPQGVVTQISDEDAKLLESDPVFIIHSKNGFVKIQYKKTDAVETAPKNSKLKAVNALVTEETPAGLEAADKSAPRTPEFYQRKENKDLPKPKLATD